MAKKIIIFTGAPAPETLSWDSSVLLDQFQGHIANFLALAPGSQSRKPSSVFTPNSTPLHASWRSVPLKKSLLHTGFSQNHGYDAGDQITLGNDEGPSQFFATTTLSFTSSYGASQDAEITEEMLSNFYEHSLAVHEDMTPSQFASNDGELQDESSLISNESTTWQDDTGSQRPNKGPLGRPGVSLSDLEDIPRPGYLTSILPQTMTVNLIVGIISIAAPRQVNTRWGTTSNLVEVIVGDNTKAGFTVTFWLPGQGTGPNVLDGLRTQDVVLMQNVALTVFMNKVYGSSLRKNLTQVCLLYRKKLDAQDKGGFYSSRDLASSESDHPQIQKTRRVREWVLQFVGRGRPVVEGRARGVYTWDQPPPDDTQ